MTATAGGTMAEDVVITRNASLMVTAVHDETVMMDTTRGHYYGLDDIGTVIWGRLETPQTFGALIDSLVARYDAERGVIAADVTDLLQMMAKQRVISFGQGS
jgi:hypothetical protein